MLQFRGRFVLTLAAGLVLAGTGLVAQNPAPPRPQGAAPAPTIPTGRQGRGGYPLPTLPAVFETFQQKVRVSVVARGMDRPWSLLILPDGDMLVSLRNSNEIRAIRKGVLDPKPLAGLPPMRRMLDLVAHPQFAQNKWVYFDYAKPLSETTQAMVLARGRWDGTTLTNIQELYVSNPSTAGGSRLAFAPDGTIYMTVSGAAGGPGPRSLNTVAGKVLRLKDDGTIPQDNPFVGRADARPEIFSIGHRDQFGLAAHPATGQMFHVELGPYGGDKINILKAGGDYGWPDYGWGRNNDSSPMGNPTTAGIEQPLLIWVPGITPSGLLFYTGDKFPAWKNNLMTGIVIRGRANNGATGVERVVFNDKMWETRRETILPELKQRIRDIRQGPDGLIYLLTEEVDGAVLKIEPAE